MRHPSAAGKFLRFVLVGSICAALYFSICYVLKAGLAWSAFSSALATLFYFIARKGIVPRESTLRRPLLRSQDLWRLAGLEWS